MIFNSTPFAVFFVLIFLLYWFPLRKKLLLQNIFLLLSSYLFYAWWDWRFLSLILLSSLTDYWVGRQLGKAEDEKKRKIWLGLSLFVNLGILCTFKYFNFFADAMQDLLGQFGVEAHWTTLQVILPVGISFYTFQTLSYTIDVYRKKVKPTRKIIPFFAFVAFFPQLVAGPIERAASLLPQFHKARRFDYALAVSGARLVLYGLFKKVVIADRLAPMVDLVFAEPTAFSGGAVVLATLAFALQIYCDFSGYSDIAIGTARLLGFRLMDNFKTPYFATSFRAFWRRWHISLSTWFRDYVYIPLGGNQRSLPRVYLNVMLTFVLSGLWHGANYTFVFWGFLHGLFLLLEMGNRQFNLIKWSLPGFIKGIFVFVLVCLAWIFFRAATIHDAFYMISELSVWQDTTANITAIFQSGFVGWQDGIYFLIALILFLSLEIKIGKADINQALRYFPKAGRWMLYYALLIAFLLIGRFDHAPQFIYFQF